MRNRCTTRCHTYAYGENIPCTNVYRTKIPQGGISGIAVSPRLPEIQEIEQKIFGDVPVRSTTKNKGEHSVQRRQTDTRDDDARRTRYDADT